MATDYTANINDIYQAIQFMPASAAEITTYNTALNNGSITLAGVQQAVIDSAFTVDVVDPVVREYQAGLARIPDMPGLQYWVGQFAVNPSALDALSVAFTNSTEFMNDTGANATTPANTALVTWFYVNVLGRQPDNPGLAYWENSGLNAAQLLKAFSQSTEADAHFAPAVDAFLTDISNFALTVPPGSATPYPTGSLFSLVPPAPLTLTPNADVPPDFATAAAGAVFTAAPVVASSGLLNNTLNAGDNLQDSSKDGTLNYTASDNSFSNPPYAVGVEMNGIKILNYIGSMSFADDHGGFQGNVTGLTVVNDTGSTGGLTLGGTAQGLNTSLTNVNITGYAPVGGIGFGTTPMFQAQIAAAAGTSATPLAVAISGQVGSSSFGGAAVLAVSTDGSAGTAASPNAAYTEWDLTLNSNADLQLSQGPVVYDVSVGGVITLKLSGAGNVALGQDVKGNWQKLTTIDASGMTGATWITGATAGGTNSTASTTNPFGLFGSAAGLLDEGKGIGGGTFALTTVDLGTGMTLLDASAASATEIAGLTTTGALVAGNEIIVANSVANAATSTAEFGGIAGFDTLGLAFVAIAKPTVLDWSQLPTSFKTVIYESPANDPVTINKGGNGLTVDFHGNDPGFEPLTVNGLPVATATLTLDFGNAALSSQDHTGAILTTGYSTIDINTTGNGTAGDPDTSGVIELSATVIGTSTAPLTVDVAGTQDFTAGGVFDVAATPTSAMDIINVTSAIAVDLGDTNFGTVNAAPSTGLIVFDDYFNSMITGSATGNNTMWGGDGGGAAGTGNTFTGGTATDTILTGIGSNTVNLGATHTGDSVTIGSWLGGSMATGGDLANPGAWGQAHGTAPLLFIAGTLGGATSSIFGNASNGGTDASVTTINHFDVTAASTDTLKFEAAMWSGNGTANNIGGFNIALTDIAISALVVAGDAVNPDLITTSGQATTTGANLVEIGGINQFSGAPALAAGLVNTGSFDLKFGGVGGLFAGNNVHFLIGYTDGTNIHIADVDVYNTTAAAQTNSNVAGVHVYASDVVELMGVNSFTNLNAHLGAFV